MATSDGGEDIRQRYGGPRPRRNVVSLQRGIGGAPTANGAADAFAPAAPADPSVSGQDGVHVTAGVAAEPVPMKPQLDVRVWPAATDPFQPTSSAVTAE